MSNMMALGILVVSCLVGIVIGEFIESRWYFVSKIQILGIFLAIAAFIMAV